MRRYLTAIFALLAICSCNREQEPIANPLLDVTPTNIEGIWMLESFDNGKSLADGCFVYIEFFRTDSSYNLYQNLNSMYTEVKSGSYFVETDPELGAVIRGNYGTEEYNYFDWSHRYIVTLTADTMRWIAKDDQENVSTYVRVDSLPEM